MTPFLSRSLAVLTVLAGVAVAAPGSARADSIGLGLFFTDGDRDDRRRHHGRRGHRESWRDHRHHRRHGPPPWAYAPPPHYGYPYARPYVRHCQVVWSHWHQNFVQVCR